MPRPRQSDPRFDHRGGTNTAFSDEILDATELRLTKNVRVGFGDLVVRQGSQRVHTAAIGSGAAVRGLVQWDAPSGQQLVAVSNGNLYHKLAADDDFTLIASTLTTSRLVRSVPYRVGSDIVLYLADGALRRWDGSELTTSIVGAPAAVDLANYKGRLWAITGDKRLYGAKLFDPATWGAGDGGLFADVETFDTEGLVRIGTVGSSLLLFKQDNTAKLTGIDQADIVIDTQTTGVSNELGLVARETLVLLQNAAFGLTVRGPAWFTEDGAKEIGDKILPAFTDANKALWTDAVAEHHADRNEIWLWLPAAADSANATGWIFNYLTQAWSGPMRGLTASCLARYQRPDGSRTIARGGPDGFVREEDVAGSGKDDVLADGSGGTPIAWDVQYPPLLFGAPDNEKTLPGVQHVNADLGAEDAQITAYWRNERGDGGFTLLTSRGVGVRPYPFRHQGARGARLVCGFSGSGGEPTVINGWDPTATISRRAR